MNKNEMKKMSESIAQAVTEHLMARIDDLLKKQETNEPEDSDVWLPTVKAAEYLGISDAYLRSIKGRFEVKKGGNANSGRLLFRKSSLYECYLKGE